MSEAIIPVAHVDDSSAISTLLTALRNLHGPTYEFAVGHWGGNIHMIAPSGAILYRFLIETNDATAQLQRGDLVRGPEADGPYLMLDTATGEVTARHSVALWPGDVVTADDQQPVVLVGSGRYFEVTVERTDYFTPRAALLRNLSDHPGGCAAYPGAFRREAIPPQRSAKNDNDQRGVNRINEHTLDMRIDRTPPPIRHYHGPIAVDNDEWVNHSEIAIILSRSIYGLPEVEEPDHGHIVIYRQPAHDQRDTVTIPVRPGSIVVTPATPENTMGHCFENCFAMLIAIPGFVAPYHMIEEAGRGRSETSVP